MTTLTVNLTDEQIIALVEQLPPPLGRRSAALARLGVGSTRENVSTKDLADYFDFFAPDDIRIKGTRIGIESILLEYIHRAKAPEAIKAMFDSVTLEQVYATILYYLKNKESVTAYLNDYLEYTRQARQSQLAEPQPAADRIRRLAEERRASSDND